MHHFIRSLALSAAMGALTCGPAVGWAADLAGTANVKPTPLRNDHPLIGAWRIDLPKVHCHELYQLRADGTSSVTSGAQAAETIFEISDQPSAKGFFRWTDQITKDNGKPDCMGSIMEVGHTSTLYLLLHPKGRKFLMCEEEDINTCIGPFVLQESI